MAQKAESKLLPHGVYPAAVVFYKDASATELDLDAIAKHAVRLAEGGVCGIVCQGSFGEAQYLSRSERVSVIRAVRAALDAKGFKETLIVAGGGSQSTRESIELVGEAADAGASYALVFTPSTWRPYLTNEHVVGFHHEVADASPIPTLVYNNPTVTAGLDIDSHTLGRIASHPNIVGCKTSALGPIARLANNANFKGSFEPFVSRSDSLLSALVVGAAGGITGLSNLCPKAHRELLARVKEGDLEGARKVQKVLADADDVVNRYGGIGVLKASCAADFGYGNGFVRRPLVEADLGTLADEDRAAYRAMVDLEKSL